ncbi:Thromboxane-A synthase [Podochytrium sp. JEL0797]|nr:Thromboxane-A synthase [Podochytrium sp. JEL0797]
MFQPKISPKNGFPNAENNWPVIGHTMSVFNPDENAYKTISKNGTRTVVNLNILGLDVLSLSTPEHVKLVLVKGFGTFVDSFWFPRWKTLSAETSVAVVDKPVEHRRLRNLLSQAIAKELSFKPASLNRVRAIQTYAPDARSLISKMSSTGSETRVFEFSKTFTFNTILFLTFGSREQDVTRMQALKPKFMLYTTGLMDFFVPVWMNGPYAKALQAKEDILGVLLEMIVERREQGAEAGTKDGLYNLLFAKGDALTDQEIADNILVFLLAGSDSTASTISSCVHYFTHAIGESEKEMLLQEIMGAEVSDHTSLTALPVLDAFIKEVLRMKPPVSGILRQFNAPTMVDEHLVPKDTYVTVPLVMTFDPNVFVEPTTFKLSRFLESSEEFGGNFSYSYVPFGAGPRQCLGMALAKLEIKVFLYELLSAFSVVKGEQPSVRGAGAVLFMNPSVRVVSQKEE